MGLLIVVKKFWITSTYKYNHQAQSISMNVVSGTMLYAKLEYYIFKGEQLLPFKRIDTIIKSSLNVSEYLYNKNLDKETSSASINDLFNFFVEQYIYDKPVNVFNNRGKLSFAEVVQNNKAHFLLPILTDTSTIKGVFLDFNEFINNIPSIVNFKEKKMTFRTSKKEEYLLDQKDSLITNYWGYRLNNEIKFSKFGSNRLFRQGNTFEFFVKVRVANPRPQGFVVLDNYATYFVPYQLDMETGIFY
jgi:hypothetical protein